MISHRKQPDLVQFPLPIWRFIFDYMDSPLDSNRLAEWIWAYYIDINSFKAQLLIENSVPLNHLSLNRIFKGIQAASNPDEREKTAELLTAVCKRQDKETINLICQNGAELMAVWWAIQDLFSERMKMKILLGCILSPISEASNLEHKMNSSYDVKVGECFNYDDEKSLYKPALMKLFDNILSDFQLGKSVDLLKDFCRYEDNEIQHLLRQNIKKFLLVFKMLHKYNRKQDIEDLILINEKIVITHEFFCVAIHEGLEPGWQTLLKSGKVNINQPYKNGKTPILIAVESGKLNAIKELIQQGADISNLLIDLERNGLDQNWIFEELLKLPKFREQIDIVSLAKKGKEDFLCLALVNQVEFKSLEGVDRTQNLASIINHYDKARKMAGEIQFNFKGKSEEEKTISVLSSGSCFRFFCCRSKPEGELIKKINQKYAVASECISKAIFEELKKDEKPSLSFLSKLIWIQKHVFPKETNVLQQPKI